ncbi:PREDICTED: B-cell antigen receptor complex-associated protein beta chain [Chaetura pelagica]|uniref:B-cell antigen receptor complex-associated protein beta chain n=1 Tax=Chaetura pelagica TaxID=8897 RepID=UPI0005239177|nr:PREDICTED: B-cell antigen receptor complex-associated protein beta chain [Chaetura pelagica]
MAGPCRRLWLLQANLWLLELLTGGISAETNSTWNSTGGGCPLVHQQPRYVAAKRNMPVHFICYSQDPQGMWWYRTQGDSHDLQEVDFNTSRYSIERKDNLINFTIFRVHSRDSGIYICGSRNLSVQEQPRPCPTELRVVGHSNLQQIRNRNTLKDAIIIIQSILLVIFISVPTLLFLDKGEEKKSPEEDHTYEGLEVDQMATYEDITPFRDVKAKWTVGEHPGEE